MSRRPDKMNAMIEPSFAADQFDLRFRQRTIEIEVRRSDASYPVQINRLGELGVLDPTNHGTSELARRRSPFQVTRADMVSVQGFSDCSSQSLGEITSADMVKHQARRKEQGYGIGHALAGNVRRRSVHGFKYRSVIAVVRAWSHAESANKTR
jgi:hypothetical protein